jgi:outer membrane protein
MSRITADEKAALLSHAMKTTFVIALFLTLPPLVALGGDRSPAALTLDNAIRIALEQSQDIAQVRLEVEKADARVDEAIGTALPAFDFSGRYTRALKKPVFFLPDFNNLGSGRTIPIEIGSDHAVEMTISARQTLFNSAVITGIGAASIYLDAAREMYRAKKLETIANVRKAFYGVLLAGEVAGMMQENLKNAEDNLKNVRLLKQQGLVSEYDELRATVGVENLRPMVIQAENNHSLAMDALCVTMGVGSSDMYTIEGDLAFSPVNRDLTGSAMEMALERNSSLKALRRQVDVNKAFVNIERSNYLPTLAAFGNYQYQVAKNDLNISARDFVGSSVVGLQLSVNIFEGLQTNSRVDRAKVDVRKSEAQVASVENNLRTAVRSVILQLEQSHKRIEAQERTVEQAERGYKIASTRFVSGSGTQLEVNDAQLALTQARVNRMQAIYDYLVAAADLDQLIGRLPEYAEQE